MDTARRHITPAPALVDIQAQRREHGGADPRELDTLCGGDLVKVGAALDASKPNGPAAEFCWIEVQPDQRGRMVGLVCTRLATVALPLWSLIEFEPRHVYEIQKAGTGIADYHTGRRRKWSVGR